MTLHKSDIENNDNNVNWLGVECPQCNGELFSQYQFKNDVYERKIRCFVPGSEQGDGIGCGYECWQSEYQQNCNPSDDQTTLDSFGVHIDSEPDDPLLLDLPVCDRCKSRKQASPSKSICRKCQDDKYSESVHIHDAVHTTSFLNPQGPAQSKPSIRKAVRVFCDSCDHDTKQVDIQPVKKGCDYDPQCSFCRSVNVFAVDVWRRGVGRVDWIDESAMEESR